MEEKDLELVDLSIRNELSDFRTEREWARDLVNSDAPAFSKDPNVIRMVIDKAGQVKIPYITVSGGHDGLQCGNLYVDTVDGIVGKWQKAYGAWQDRYPGVGALCREFGDENNLKLYDRGSMIRKWSGCFEAR
jgi:hypothetical protein